MLNLRPADYEKLQYIHSNQKITTSLFKAKFFPDKTLRRAFQLLKLYQKKGYLFTVQNHILFEAIFALTDKALKELYERGYLLAWNLRQPHIRLNKETHDERVIALRILIESTPEFDDVFYLSDYEMEQGINREAKWKFYRELEEEGRKEFLSKWKPKTVKVGSRRPDGYFDALIQKETKPYILEYENLPYGTRLLLKVVGKLEENYPEATKLIVCKDSHRTITMKNGIERVMGLINRRGGFKSNWYIADFPTIEKTPFLKAFQPIQTTAKPHN